MLLLLLLLAQSTHASPASPASPALTRLYLVRATTSTRQSVRAELDARSPFVQYVPRDTFLCALDPPALRAVSALSGVTDVSEPPALSKRYLCGSLYGSSVAPSISYAQPLSGGACPRGGQGGSACDCGAPYPPLSYRPSAGTPRATSACAAPSPRRPAP